MVTVFDRRSPTCVARMWHGRHLLTRRFLYLHPDLFSAVRGLGLVNSRCPCGSGAVEGCLSPWLPAWLPADDSVTPWSRRHLPACFRQPGRAPSCPRPLPRTQ